MNVVYQTKVLQVQQEGTTLLLQGELNRDNLPEVWSKTVSLVKGIEVLDLHKLKRIDSAGLAMLVRLASLVEQKNKHPLRFIGLGKQVLTLIKLYNLQDVIFG